MHVDGNHNGVGDGKVTANGLVFGVLHLVDVIRDALGIGVIGRHLHR